MIFKKIKKGNKKKRERQEYFGAAHAEASGRNVETKIKKIKKKSKKQNKKKRTFKEKKRIRSREKGGELLKK